MCIRDRYEGKAEIGKVDVDEQGELAMRYGVMSIPTVIFFKDGKEIDRKAVSYTHLDVYKRQPPRPPPSTACWRPASTPTPASWCSPTTSTTP